jgi:BlaI family transcriptional regulator, penicillinase repressor
MNHDQHRIPDAERDILACLGRLGEATVRELQQALQPIRAMEPASVLTLLKRLEAKNLVCKRKADKGKAFVFRPTEESIHARRHLVKDLFQRVFGGDTMAFMASFLETRKPTAEEIEQLQQLLDELRADKPQKRTSRK